DRRRRRLDLRPVAHCHALHTPRLPPSGPAAAVPPEQGNYLLLGGCRETPSALDVPTVVAVPIRRGPGALRNARASPRWIPRSIRSARSPVATACRHPRR